MCRPACQEIQPNAFSCGLPIPQPKRPFYFVDVSSLPRAAAAADAAAAASPAPTSPALASPSSALPPRSGMYSRLLPPNQVTALAARLSTSLCWLLRYIESTTEGSFADLA